MQRVEEAPALAFCRRHRAAGVEQLGGAALADDARQDRAGAHVAAGEPDAGEQEGRLRLGRGEAQVGGHGDDRAGAGAHAVDRRDDRLAAADHRLHQVAGHAREGQQLASCPWPTSGPMISCTSPPEQKLPPFGGEHHHVDVVGVARGSRKVSRSSA